MKLADTEASIAAGDRWIEGQGTRGALELYGIDFDDLREWASLGVQATRLVSASPDVFEMRFCGAVAAALVLGIELARSGEVE